MWCFHWISTSSYPGLMCRVNFTRHHYFHFSWKGVWLSCFPLCSQKPFKFSLHVKTFNQFCLQSSSLRNSSICVLVCVFKALKYLFNQTPNEFTACNKIIYCDNPLQVNLSSPSPHSLSCLSPTLTAVHPAGVWWAVGGGRRIHSDLHRSWCKASRRNHHVQRYAIA